MARLTIFFVAAWHTRRGAKMTRKIPTLGKGLNTKPTRARPWQTISRLTGKILSIVLVTQPVFPSAAKPWICPICQHTSSTTSNLNNHIKKVHKVTLCQAEMMTKRSRYGREMTEDEVEQNRIAVQVESPFIRYDQVCIQKKRW